MKFTTSQDLLPVNTSLVHLVNVWEHINYSTSLTCQSYGKDSC